MKTPDLDFAVPQNEREMASFIAKLQETLRYICDNVGGVRVVSSAPVVNDIHLVGDGKGGNLTELIVLDDSTQTNRRIYYRNAAGTLRLIESD